MDLMEYEARSLLSDAGIPVPNGVMMDSATTIDSLSGSDELRYPMVVKAQVAIGGRGKAGGIRIVENRDSLQQAISEISGMNIRGHIVRQILIVEKVEVAKELYLSVLLDRNTKKHMIVFSARGGVEIERTAQEDPDAVIRLPIDPLLGYTNQDGLYLGSKAGLTFSQQKELAAIVGKLYAVVRDNDCLLAEINPLVVTKSGELIAVDAKLSVDDCGVFRHPKLVAIKDSHLTDPLIREAAEYRFLYIPCDIEGKVVVMSNGSGMLMSCIDHITRGGNRVSAVLDLGGGSTADRIEHAVRILFQTNGSKVMFINIFGGITRCNEVGQGIRNAIERHGIDRPVVVRFEGTNKEEGRKIIQGLSGVHYVEGLIDGEEVVRSLLK